jgi:hypothetical protein
MVSSDTLRLLRWHAGLGGDPLDADSVSGATATGLGVSVAVAAFLQVLELLNHEMNGPRPAAIAAVGDDEVPREAAYAVAEVSRLLRAAENEDAARQIDAAWSAVLAGDVHDVIENVAEERRASALEAQGPILTAEDAFAVMFEFLNGYWAEFKTANLADVLGDVQPAYGGQSSDPAAWLAWLRAVEVIREKSR